MVKASTTTAADATTPVASTAPTHEQIVEHFNAYLAEHDKFENRGVKAAGTRARKALGELGKLSKARRAEIQSKKNNGAEG